VETADAGRLILMAYEGAIHALAEAEEALEARDYEAKGRLVIRAQEVVTELMASLNPEAGSLAHNLAALYRYMLRTLTLVEPPSEGQRIAQVRRMLAELYTAWEAIINGPQLREVPRRTGPRGTGS
jgi:flagellar protein FliS